MRRTVRGQRCRAHRQVSSIKDTGCSADPTGEYGVKKNFLRDCGENGRTRDSIMVLRDGWQTIEDSLNEPPEKSEKTRQSLRRH